MPGVGAMICLSSTGLCTCVAGCTGHRLLTCAPVELFCGRYVGSRKQFAYIDAPALEYNFTAKGAHHEDLAQIDRNFAGFAKEVFTDAGQYAIHFFQPATDSDVEYITAESRGTEDVARYYARAARSQPLTTPSYLAWGGRLQRPHVRARQRPDAAAACRRPRVRYRRGHRLLFAACPSRVRMLCMLHEGSMPAPCAYCLVPVSGASASELVATPAEAYSR